MFAKFLRSPRFHKWSLFTSLVVSLGFNLSMNPQMANVARNTVYSLDLAQEAAKPAVATAAEPAAKAVADTPRVNLLDKNLDLKTVYNIGDLTGDERFKNYGALLTPQGDKMFFVLKRKVGDTEAYESTGCDECGRKLLVTTTAFATDKLNIAQIIGQISDQEKANMLKDTKATAKVDKVLDKTARAEAKEKAEADKGLQQFAESCRKSEEDDLMQCQYDAMTKELDSCKKYDRSCEKKANAMFKPFAELFKACAGGRIGKLKGRALESEDCDSAKEFANDMLEDLKSESGLKKAASFLQSQVLDNAANFRKDLQKRHLDPLTAGRMLKNEFDNRVGTRIVDVPRYNENGLIIGYDKTVTDMPMPNSESANIFRKLSSNERFSGKSSAALDFFHRNYYDSLGQTRTAMDSNPMAYNFPSVDIENGEYATILPPEQLLKARQNTGSIRNAQGTSFDFPMAPQQARSGQPGTVMGSGTNPASNTLLSPQQRARGDVNATRVGNTTNPF